MKVIKYNKLYLGLSTALFAAILNSSIGILNEYAFEKGASFYAVSLYKTVFALIILSVISVFSKKYREKISKLKNKWKELFLLSLFGVFTLYFFETYAFSLSNIPLTAFMIYVPGFISIILGVVFLKEKISFLKVFVFFMLLIGAYFLLVGAENYNFKIGLIYAFIGGAGYSIFIFLSRYYLLDDGVAVLWWIFLFGSISLSIPALYTDNYYINLESVIYIILLAVFPTIGGFFMTLLAAKNIDAGVIQLVETSDPLFATIFAMLIFGHTLSIVSSFGTLIIFISLLILALSEKINSKIEEYTLASRTE